MIIKEADRLQLLVDRLLTPHRPAHPGALNIHEVCERVRSLILAEFPDLRIHRDYDSSLPDLHGDREQLIQAVLNIEEIRRIIDGAQRRIRYRDVQAELIDLEGHTPGQYNLEYGE